MPASTSVMPATVVVVVTGEAAAGVARARVTVMDKATVTATAAGRRTANATGIGPSPLPPSAARLRMDATGMSTVVHAATATAARRAGAVGTDVPGVVAAAGVPLAAAAMRSASVRRSTRLTTIRAANQ